GRRARSQSRRNPSSGRSSRPEPQPTLLPRRIRTSQGLVVMQPHSTEPSQGADRMGAPRRWAAAWDRFWFTPADPTILALVRICTGLIVVFPMVPYPIVLQDLGGRGAWLDLKTRQEWYREMAQPPFILDWSAPFQPPGSSEQEKYMEEYRR